MSYLSHAPVLLVQNLLIIPVIWLFVSLLLDDKKFKTRFTVIYLVTVFANFFIATMCHNAHPSIQNLWFVILFPLCLLAEKQITRRLSQL